MLISLVLLLLIITAFAAVFVRAWQAFGSNGFEYRLTLASCILVASVVGGISLLAWLSLLDDRRATSILLLLGTAAAAALLSSLAKWAGPVDRVRLNMDWARPLQASTWAVLLLVVMVALQVLLYTPTGYDAMAYHLPKVAHLIDVGNVYPFSVNYTHINETPWGSAYGAYALWLMGGERAFGYLGLIQFLGLIACILLIRSIARDLVLLRESPTWNPAWAVTFTVLALSPMMLMQGPSGRNDLVVTAFCLLLMRGFLLLAVSSVRAINSKSAFLMMPFGVAGVLSTKPNMLLQVAVFMVLLILTSGVARRSARRVVVDVASIVRHRRYSLMLLVSLVFVLALGLPFAQTVASNRATYGGLSGPAGSAVLGELPNWRGAVCRTSMTLAYEGKVGADSRMPAAVILSPISRATQASLEWASSVCGAELLSSTNNLTPFVDPFSDETVNGNEDNQSSPLQLHVFVMAAVVLFALGIKSLVLRMSGRRPVRQPGSADQPSGATFIPSVALSLVLTLGVAGFLGPWQYYSNSRFLLPSWIALIVVASLAFYMWMCDRSAAVLRRIPERLIRVFTVIVLVLATIQTANVVAQNLHYPLPASGLWSEANRGKDWTSMSRAGTPAGGEDQITQTIQFVVDAAIDQSCARVGVEGVYIWWFPLWLAARESGVTIVDINVENESSKFELASDANACLVFGLEAEANKESAFYATDGRGHAVWSR